MNVTITSPFPFRGGAATAAATNDGPATAAGAGSGAGTGAGAGAGASVGARADADVFSAACMMPMDRGAGSLRRWVRLPSAGPNGLGAAGTAASVTMAPVGDAAVAVPTVVTPGDLRLFKRYIGSLVDDLLADAIALTAVTDMTSRVFQLRVQVCAGGWWWSGLPWVRAGGKCVCVC
jgi:hypothetical protein